MKLYEIENKTAVFLGNESNVSPRHYYIGGQIWYIILSISIIFLYFQNNIGYQAAIPKIHRLSVSLLVISIRIKIRI